MQGKWRISELRTAVELALGDPSYNGQSSGRVQQIPDTRAIRYYTTLGLLDRADSMVGRTAYYGKRHIEQLVAIKRLQAHGHSLTQIQATITGISNRKLRGLANLPDQFWQTLDDKLVSAQRLMKKSSPESSRSMAQAMPSPSIIDEPDSKPAAPQTKKGRSAGARRFWSTSPSSGTVAGKSEKKPEPVFKPNPHQGLTIRHETRIELTGGVSISVPVDPSVELSPELAKKLNESAQRILSQLKEAGLISDTSNDNPNNN